MAREIQFPRFWVDCNIVEDSNLTRRDEFDITLGVIIFSTHGVINSNHDTVLFYTMNELIYWDLKLRSGTESVA